MMETTTPTAAQLLPEVARVEGVLSGLKAALESARQDGAKIDKKYESTPVDESDLLWRCRQEQDTSLTRISRIERQIQEVEDQLRPLQTEYARILKMETNTQQDADLAEALTLLKQKAEQGRCLIDAGRAARQEVLNELRQLAEEWRERSPISFPMPAPRPATPEETRRAGHYNDIMSVILAIERQRFE